MKIKKKRFRFYKERKNRLKEQNFIGTNYRKKEGFLQYTSTIYPAKVEILINNKR